MDVDKLVKMANQIAANLDYGPDKDKDKAVAATADHLRRFWTPEMRATIIAGHQRKLIDLSPLAGRAVEKLAAAETTAA
jgi:formate dehydrogenase subunit delta